MSKYCYSFNCRNCGCLKYLDDSLRKGYYCIPIKEGKSPIHADEDYVVRCDDYQPLQMQLSIFFDEEDDLGGGE